MCDLRAISCALCELITNSIDFFSRSNMKTCDLRSDLSSLMAINSWKRVICESSTFKIFRFSRISSTFSKSRVTVSFHFGTNSWWFTLGLKRNFCLFMFIFTWTNTAISKSAVLASDLFNGGVGSSVTPECIVSISDTVDWMESRVDFSWMM